MATVFDFSGMEHSRGHEYRRIACFARALWLSGEAVAWMASGKTCGRVHAETLGMLSGIEQVGCNQGFRSYVFSSEAYIRNEASLSTAEDALCIMANGKQYGIGPENRISGACLRTMVVDYTPWAELNILDRLYRVPHIVSDKVLAEFNEHGLLDFYLSDQIRTVRDAYDAGVKKSMMGFIGTSGYGRKEAIRSLCGVAEYAEWASVFLDADIPPAPYLTTMTTWKSALYLPGQIFSTFRLAEACLMGVPLVLVPDRINYQTRYSKKNCIILKDFLDHPAFYRAVSNDGELDRIKAGQRQAYLTGWSPLSQIKGLIK